MTRESDVTVPAEQFAGQVKWDAQGLAPAIVQDANTKEVLTLAYMNEESLKRSIQSGETWFWSRSRQEFWHKGATSGNVQKIVSLSYDCDGDALLVGVLPAGPACHTGRVSCFFNNAELEKNAEAAGGGTAEAESERVPGLEPESGGAGAADGAGAAGANGRFDVLAELESIIAQRYIERPEGAYTTYLFEKGIDKILKKVGEETAESIIAAKNGDNDELQLEVSDLIYHLLVLLEERKLPLDRIMDELARRHERPRRD
ncbi:bifunctional phosphoribosyl-AMP cyclohydrolase/phosphoribosyl-ATP diphosphatase HisIE [Saccharibacillus sp. CPCC 101409]|uniref:bifunctional phosphoribosyl-AMP cyclohydrolase/phosphoribosyl-ATP diphosphatase HisIE n=1 Tax=Saccharibacillus sp. CPCC 101409 TaxID=3058041 RepID=UPI002672CA24|nr:bifunctional phosphoribosyl-AMP cyclohydrolase/phosphoribosyl-ATP diphosphatase HisIE [Saccharibacillus sp. CPCC 101409]MDO3413119.1 bifunctional phosphoribosyl-AMP cyclohydrolase/phosphoribosyl-ATP diphosphatase HisIE [Saccharibacillus sp. CPCC 101409]